MKSILRLVLIITGLVFLTSCCLMTARSNWQQTCNSNYLTKNQCGVTIIDRCKNLCETCSFNEKQCTLCWACVSAQCVGGPCVYHDL